MKLKVYKIRDNAKLPVRAHPTDAGMDLFYCPSEKEIPFVKDATITIARHAGALIPTGLKIEVPEGYMLEIKNKSGVATKKSLVTGACVVDNGYDGEIFVNLNNIGGQVQRIVAGQKIAQAVLVPIITCDIEEIEDDAIYNNDTSRGSGGFGSTGDF